MCLTFSHQQRQLLREYAGYKPVNIGAPEKPHQRLLNVCVCVCWNFHSLKFLPRRVIHPNKLQNYLYTKRCNKIWTPIVYSYRLLACNLPGQRVSFTIRYLKLGVPDKFFINAIDYCWYYTATEWLPCKRKCRFVVLIIAVSPILQNVVPLLLSRQWPSLEFSAFCCLINIRSCLLIFSIIKILSYHTTTSCSNCYSVLWP